MIKKPRTEEIFRKTECGKNINYAKQGRHKKVNNRLKNGET